MPGGVTPVIHMHCQIPYGAAFALHADALRCNGKIQPTNIPWQTTTYLIDTLLSKGELSIHRSLEFQLVSNHGIDSVLVCHIIEVMTLPVVRQILNLPLVRENAYTFRA